MTQPTRLRLSRARGFDLQAASLALNGLPAVSVARPSRWGNPFRVTGSVNAALAVKAHAAWLASRPDLIRAARLELHGKNLACWCPLEGAPCHADELLRLVAAGEE